MDLEYHPEAVATMMRKCKQIDDSLENTNILEHIVGLRPGRKEIRLEAEYADFETCWVIHNYSQGGRFTLSWGCAEEVVELAKQQQISTQQGIRADKKIRSKI